MANRNSDTTTRRPRDSEGRFKEKGWVDSARERPYTAAALAAGVGAAAGVAGAFLWSRREQLGEMASTGMDKLSEMKAEHMGGGDTRDQSEIAEEALRLKETGKKSQRPTDTVSNQQTKAGAVAY